MTAVRITVTIPEQLARDARQAVDDGKAESVSEETERAGWTIVVPVGPLAQVWRDGARQTVRRGSSHTCGLSSWGGCSPRMTLTTISAASAALAAQTPLAFTALCGVRTKLHPVCQVDLNGVEADPEAHHQAQLRAGNHRHARSTSSPGGAPCLQTWVIRRKRRR